MITISLVVMLFTIHHKKMMMMEQSSFLFSEGLYFVERVNLNDIRLAKSRSNLYDGNYQKSI